MQVASDAYAAVSAATAAVAANVQSVTKPATAADAAAEAAIAALDLALTSIVATQVSVTYFSPLGYRMALSAPEAFSRLGESFFDTSDPNRPINTGVPMYFSLWVGVVTAQEMKDLQRTLDALLLVIGEPQVETYPSTKSFLEDAGGYPPVLTTGSGQLPDWRSMTLADFGVLGRVSRGLLALRAMLVPAKSFTAQLVAQLESISRRANAVADQLQSISNIFGSMAQLQANVAGIDSLMVYGNATLTEQVAAMMAAGSAPDSPVNAADLNVGFVAVHTQSAIPAGPAFFRSLLGQ